MKLVKADDDKKLFGVCGGLARYFGFDSSLLRVLFVILTIIGVGSPVLVYLILAAIMPKEYFY